MPWERIEREKGSEDVEIHPKDALLLRVKARLNRMPPAEWQDFFKYPSGHSPLGMDSPVLEGTTISIMAEQDKEKHALDQIDERIMRANLEYERDVVPRLQQQEDQQKRFEEDNARRLEEARKRLKG